MKKKILSVIVVGVLIAVSMSNYQKKSVLAAAAEDVGIDISNHTPIKGEAWEEDDIWYTIYDDHVEVNSYRGTDGNMEIKPYISGKPVTAISNWSDTYDYDGSWWGISEWSIDVDYKVKRLVIPHTVKHLKIANWRDGTQNSLFERSNTLEELIIEDGAELSICSPYENNPRKLNLIDTSDRMDYLGNLKSVYIGSDVKEFSKYLLCGRSMAEIKVSENNPYYSSEDNILFNHDKTELIISGSANPLKEYTVPATVEKIDIGFESCQSLSKIVVGENVKSIGNSRAFDTESDNLEVTVPYGSYAETYVKDLKADYIKYTVTGAPEQTETVTPTTPEPEITPDSSAPATGSPSTEPEPGTPVPTASINGSPGNNSDNGPYTKPATSIVTSEADKKQEEAEISDTKNNSVTAGSANIVKKPGKVKKVNITKRKRALKLKWKKASGSAGYQICYSTSSKFKKKSTKTKTTTKTTITLKKLKARKNYYVKVRAYVMKNGRRVYGMYSKVVKKKTK